jgi:hypothetical protein
LKNREIELRDTALGRREMIKRKELEEAWRKMTPEAKAKFLEME